MRSVTVHSYAKVNYTLDVLSLRPDGYHGIASVMQAISLSDEITISVRDDSGIAFVCTDPGIPSDERNLSWRAADAILKETGLRTGIEIQLRKTIPSQAGLGGGSSNAAYTLMAVNHLLGNTIQSTRLVEIAAGLGSDVPFFLTGGAAAVRGRGEVITPQPDGPGLWFVVVKPDANVSTGEAYAALDAIPQRVSARATRKMAELLAEGDAERVIARMSNDFEQAIFPSQSSISLLHDELLMARARNARLCGSGSAVFGVTTDERAANEIARIMALKYRSVFVCRALTREQSLPVLPEEEI